MKKEFARSPSEIAEYLDKEENLDSSHLRVGFGNAFGCNYLSNLQVATCLELVSIVEVANWLVDWQKTYMQVIQFASGRIQSTFEVDEKIVDEL